MRAWPLLNPWSSDLTQGCTCLSLTSEATWRKWFFLRLLCILLLSRLVARRGHGRKLTQSPKIMSPNLKLKFISEPLVTTDVTHETYLFDVYGLIYPGADLYVLLTWMFLLSSLPVLSSSLSLPAVGFLFEGPIPYNGYQSRRWEAQAGSGRSEVDAELLCAFHQRHWLPLMNSLAAGHALSCLATLKKSRLTHFAC